MWDDERIAYGSSAFYQMKSGRSVLDYPERFDAGAGVGEQTLTVLDVDDGNNPIRVELKLLDGVFVAMHFFRIIGGLRLVRTAWWRRCVVRCPIEPVGRVPKMILA